MRALLLNLAEPQGRRLIRSYSGGYGDMLADTDGSLIQFPPLELLRMAGIARHDGIETVIIDQQVSPDAQLPDHTDVIVTTLSLPTLSHDCAASAALGKRYPGSRRFIYLSIRDDMVWSKSLAESAGATLMLPEAVPMISRILRGVACQGTVSLLNGVITLGDRMDDSPLDDEEPLPARDLLDHSPYTFSPFGDTSAPISPVATAQTSFGCPYPCGYYCPYPAAEGKRFRAYSPTHVLKEFEQMSAMGLKGVVYRDPVFTFNAARTQEICSLITDRGIMLPWWCETRIDTLTPELLGSMAAAGCVGMEVGVESGDDEVLRTHARKRLSQDMVRDFQQWTADVGIVPHFLFMIGIPGESARNIAQTFQFIMNLELPSTSFNLSTITPYPGTPLYAEAKRQGWIEQDWQEHTGYDVVMRTGSLSSASLNEAEKLGCALHILMAQKSTTARQNWEGLQRDFVSRVDNWVHSVTP